MISLLLCLQALTLQAAFASEEVISEPTRMNLAVHDNRISVSLVGAPLADVLHRIGQETGIRILLYGDCNEPLSMSFDDLPIDKALHRLTSNHSLSLIYHLTPSNASRPDEKKNILEAWFFGSNSSRHTNGKTNGAFTDISPVQPIKIAELRQTLNTPNTTFSDQYQIIMRLSATGDSASVMAMASCLGSDDKELRKLLVDGISSAQDERSIQILGQILYGDSDSEVRMKAVRGLADRQDEPAAHAFLKGALSSTDEEVQDLAQQLLIDGATSR